MGVRARSGGSIFMGSAHHQKLIDAVVEVAGKLAWHGR